MAKSLDLLLEIGVEELPAHFCAPALGQLEKGAAAALREARLAHGLVKTLGTPRRLTLLIHNVSTMQEARDSLVRGPAARAAFDATGAPTKAAEGFARAHGIAVDDLVTQSDDKDVTYVYARKHEAGQSAASILPDLLRELVLGLEFPMAMRWGRHRVRFARPIRWLVCLFGAVPLPLEIAGVQARHETSGLRTTVPSPQLLIPAAADYESVLTRAGLMVDPVARRAAIQEQIGIVANELGGTVPFVGDLLDEVTWLVEYPLAFAGRFDTEFLAVPAEVLVTSMREHQRYFPVYDREGRTLLPYFIAVRNGSAAYLNEVRHGNEKVLQARLSDARFFWDEDRHLPLEARLEALKDVVFQEELGSQYLRTERIVGLASIVAAALDVDATTERRVERTAWLCKCDLVTAMVAEFPELQGAMGRAYALAEGEDPRVAEGIFEHYLPRGADDLLPQEPAGMAVGLADRLNTLAGFFGLGLIPTGSADPYALRRAAQGVAAIVVDRGLHLSLDSLLKAALDGHAGFDAKQRAAALEALREFFRARLDGLLKERGIRYDVADAVLAAGFDDMTDAVARATALNALLDSPDFLALLIAFKRAANILHKSAKDGEAVEVVPDRLGPDDAALWQAFAGLREAATGALAADYTRFYKVMTGLKVPVDTYFDRVLIMDPDLEVRRHRLALLRTIVALLARPADLSRLAI